MENGSFIDDLPVKNGDVPYKSPIFPWFSHGFPIKKWWIHVKLPEGSDLKFYR
jgi:hypothetical protein